MDIHLVPKKTATMLEVNGTVVLDGATLTNAASASTLPASPPLWAVFASLGLAMGVGIP
jgi:predicted phage tail protein